MGERKKLFYKIGEVCKIAGIQPHVLRYWETEFRMLAPAKNSSGQRIYRERDVETVLLIKKLLYEDGYTIAGANKRLTAELGRRSSANAIQEGRSEAVTDISSLKEKPEGRPQVEQLLIELKEELEQILTLLSKGDIE